MSTKDAASELQDAMERWHNSGGFHACDESQCFEAVYTLAAAYMAEHPDDAPPDAPAPASEPTEHWQVVCTKCGYCGPGEANGDHPNCNYTAHRVAASEPAGELPTEGKELDLLYHLKDAAERIWIEAEYDCPGDTPELCGYLCGECKGDGPTESEVKHKPDCFVPMALAWLPANAELSRLRVERDKLHNEAQDYYDRLGLWQDKTGCSHPTAAEYKLTALRNRLERAEVALREIAEGHPPSSHFPRCHLDGERAMDIASAYFADKGATDAE
jgi:hypothetical protein